MAAPPAVHAVDTAADDICLMAFTSGTTGVPKGTMHFHRDVMAACACWPPHVLRATADDVFIGSPPLAFTFGLGGLLLFPLAIGASTVLLEKASPDALLPAIARYRATCASPHRPRTARWPRWRRSTTCPACASASAPARRCPRPRAALAPGHRHRDHRRHRLHRAVPHLHLGRRGQARPGATGLPVPGYRAAVLDDEGRELPPGRSAGWP
jgi:2-aminobenzoate-CoA ligase